MGARLRIDKRFYYNYNTLGGGLSLQELLVL